MTTSTSALNPIICDHYRDTAHLAACAIRALSCAPAWPQEEEEQGRQVLMACIAAALEHSITAGEAQRDKAG